MRCYLEKKEHQHIPKRAGQWFKVWALIKHQYHQNYNEKFCSCVSVWAPKEFYQIHEQ
jgi:hypothetical protein